MIEQAASVLFLIPVYCMREEPGLRTMDELPTKKLLQSVSQRVHLLLIYELPPKHQTSGLTNPLYKFG